MIEIREGMTPTEFIDAVNGNSALLITNYNLITNIMNGQELQTILNGNFSRSDVLLGIRGRSYKSILNVNFNRYNVSAYRPTDLSVNWIDDFARITFTDNSGGSAQHEIWESVNGGTYTLLHTLGLGVNSLDYSAWQNASLNFKIRAKNGTLYSEYSSVVNIITPLVLKTDQSILSPIQFYQITVETAGKSIHVDWGDSTSQDVSDVQNTVNTINKNYSTTGQYYITISGDTDWLWIIQIMQQSALAGTDISKWIVPSHLYYAHLYENGFIGDITSMTIPSSCVGLHFGGNPITADITNWIFPDNYFDFHIQSLIADGIIGDITNWEMPSKTSHLSISGYITGNLTNWELFTSPSYSEIVASMASTNPVGLTGDLSGWIIPTWEGQLSPTQLTFNIGCHFTKLPRGNFRFVSLYNFANNDCSQNEIDDLLAYIDAYFVGGVVPVSNCIYTLSGTGMGIPSTAGLASRTSIISKYTEAGKTCSIVVNS